MNESQIKTVIKVAVNTTIDKVYAGVDAECDQEYIDDKFTSAAIAALEELIEEMKEQQAQFGR